MNTTRPLRHMTGLSLLVLLATLGAATATASAATTAFPPSLGKLCGHVTGASWKFQGQTGTQYGVVAQTTASCTIAMKSVSGLSRQKPHTGALGPQTLSGPTGFRCAGSGIKLAHAGFCGSNHAKFLWAPQLKK
jgi:hypothetical protein